MPRSGDVDVLFLPLHRWLVANRGSESAWALSIASAATNLGLESLAVVGQADRGSVRTLEAAGVAVTSLDITPTRGFLEDSAFYWKLIKTGHRLIRSRAPRVLHHVFPFGLSQGFNPLVIVRPACPVVVGPLLYQPATDRSDEEDLDLMQGIVKHRSNRTHTQVLSPILRRLSLATLSRSNVILSDCKETRKQMEGLYPELRMARWVILPGGGVPKDFLTAGLRSPSRYRGEGPLRIGTLTYLRRRKRVRLMLEALAGLDHREVRCEIAGDGPGLTDLRSTAARLGLDSVVTFHGAVPWSKAPGFLASLDVFFSLDVFPHEALAAVQEAMMCGCAILTSGPRLLSEPVPLSYGYDIGSGGDIDTIRSVLITFIRDGELVRRFGEAARTRAISQFSSDAIRNTLGKVYRSLTL